MSSIRSALDELKAEDLRFLSDEQLEADLLELENGADVLLAERLRRVAEAERRRVHQRDGYVSTTAWLADRAGRSFSSAKREVAMATALQRMPTTRVALAAGEISESAVEILAAAREADPAAFENAEETLVELAREVSIRELSGHATAWRQAVDEASGEHTRRLFERRSFSMALTPAGSWRVKGDLDPETGQTVNTAIRSLVDAQVRRGLDLRTSEQRSADALGEICRQHLDRSDRPEVAGERPHLTVTVDAAQLRQVSVHPAELTRRIACDASITRVIARGRSEILDVGRKTPVVPAALRRAVAARDGSCAFPRCDRPPSWTDAHHVTHWADGGETNLDNLVLLCRPHHRMIHDGFGVTVEHGRATFRRPDGSVIEDRAPP